MSKNLPTDRQLAKALRQAALRIDALRGEVESMRTDTMPVADRLTVHDFVPLLRKASTNNQLRTVTEAIDALYFEDPSIMAADDWRYLSSVLAKCKKPQQGGMPNV